VNIGSFGHGDLGFCFRRLANILCYHSRARECKRSAVDAVLVAEVLKQRARELPAPIQMCDALSRNKPKLEGVEPRMANCLAHGRRQVVEVVDNFPEECRYVLETLRGVYHDDALARERELSPEDRLRFHQEHSGPLMKGLHEWMEAQLAEHKTEPNSGLGKAISYLLNHWPKLTLFLKEPGAPIDNNIVERALKKAILNRKNALFYKTLNGAARSAICS
jgi:hypothetical protein